jgi:hypothetical protein
LRILLRRATRIFLKTIPCFKPAVVFPQMSFLKNPTLHQTNVVLINEILSPCFKNLGLCATKHHRTRSDPKRPCTCNGSHLQFAICNLQQSFFPFAVLLEIPHVSRTLSCQI